MNIAAQLISGGWLALVAFALGMALPMNASAAKKGDNKIAAEEYWTSKAASNFVFIANDSVMV